ncbi:MAG TPA: hypothetical protein VKQ36_03815, partial [Ktedonobacterales bacterium]|nr:hypothetical protein [Ktedonobacterales bacterium]
ATQAAGAGWLKGLLRPASSRASHRKRRSRAKTRITIQRASSRMPQDETSGAQSLTFVVAMLLCWLVIPIVVSFALTQPFFNAHLFLDRYLVVVIPAICLLAGLGVALLSQRALAALRGMRLGLRKQWLAWGAQAALAVALLVVAIPQAQGYYANADTQGLHTGAPWIEQRYQPGDGIACYPGSWCMLPMTYYLYAEAGPAHFDANSPSDDLSVKTLAAYGAGHARVFLIIAVFHPKPGVLPQLIALRRWADAHWKLLGQFSSAHTDYQYIGAFLTTSITILLYQTGAKTRS